MCAIVYILSAKNARSAAMVAVVCATLGPPMVLRVAMQVYTAIAS